MPREAHRIDRSDIIAPEQYATMRKEWRRKLVAEKRDRRVAVGPFVTLHFENWDTMWGQVQEMLHIERGGEAQIKDELEAYNPLVPNGRELVATMMIEIEDAVRRTKLLAGLGHIEEAVSLQIGGETIAATPENDTERTTPEGKTASVHFLHFALSDAQVAQFRGGAEPVMLAIKHPNYGHMAILSEATRKALAADFA